MLKDMNGRRRKAGQYQQWAKESKVNRIIWNHKHRAAVRNALIVGDFENVPMYKAEGY
jgi:hypothetical protein